MPDYNGAAELKVSTPILASTVEPLTAPLTPAQHEENPYNVFGAMKIEPSADGKFSKAGEFNLVFFVYGAGDAGGGKPNVVLEYSFYQKQAEGEKYFNKTAPQELNGATLPPDFNVAAGHQVPGMLSIPLASFPAGDYRLEIKVTDKAEQQDADSKRRLLPSARVVSRRRKAPCGDREGTGDETQTRAGQCRRGRAVPDRPRAARLGAGGRPPPAAAREPPAAASAATELTGTGAAIAAASPLAGAVVSAIGSESAFAVSDRDGPLHVPHRCRRAPTSCARTFRATCRRGRGWCRSAPARAAISRSRW